MIARRWKDIRAESGLNKDSVAAHQERMLAEVRAHRLAELRTRQESRAGDLGGERFPVADGEEPVGAAVHDERRQG